MQPSNHFSKSSSFPGFSGCRFSRVQVFQGPGFLGSRFFRVQVYQVLGFSGSRFFRVQVFLSPGFSGSRFFRFRVHGPGPGFRSSHGVWPVNRITSESFSQKNHTKNVVEKLSPKKQKKLSISQFVFILSQVEDYWNILKLNWRQHAFTTYEAFLKNKKSSGISLLASYLLHDF